MTKTRKPPRQKLEPYKALIRERLETSPQLSAKRLFDEVKADGYDGSYSQLVAFVKTLRKSSMTSEQLERERVERAVALKVLATNTKHLGRLLIKQKADEARRKHIKQAD